MASQTKVSVFLGHPVYSSSTILIDILFVSIVYSSCLASNGNDWITLFHYICNVLEILD